MAAPAIKTHVITEKDNIVDVVETYAKPYLKEGDILFISEKSVACSQKRAIPMSEIKPRPLAKFLTKFVYKSPYGIGWVFPRPWKWRCASAAPRAFSLQRPARRWES